MKTLRTLMATAGLILLLALNAVAQTTVNSTSLAAAITDRAPTQITVASASTIAVGDTYVIVQGGHGIEAGTVRAVNGVFLTVSRANLGGINRTHASGATLYTGVPARFFCNVPTGTCTRTSETYLPLINLTNGNVTQCHPGNFWYKLEDTFNVTCRALLIADMVDQSCWTADQDYAVVAIREVHKTKEAGGTLTLIGRKNTGTQAPASGVALNTALDMAAAATDETVRTATLTTTVADLLVASGNRLSLDFTDDTAGELAGVTVTFTLVKR